MENSRKDDKNRRLHFGVVCPSLDNTCKYRLLDDISLFAEKHDVHLTVYFGTYETTNYDFASHYEPCFETIASGKVLDGVIIFSGFIAHNIGIDKFENYVASIPQHIPVVSIALPMPGVLSVMVDNTTAMRNAVDHLIKQHGKKHIAFVKGPDGHPEAEARLKGYKQALEDNGIEVDDKYLIPGSFTPGSGRVAAAELIDNRSISYDAIACCNDEAALGVLKELKERNISVPDDVAVIGYDDCEDAPRHIPSISTVRQDFSHLGEVAAKMLFDKANGKRVENSKFVVPEYIARRSCGCPEINRSKMEYVYEASDDKLLHRRVADNLVLLFDIDLLADELYKSLPLLSINTVLVGLYHSQIKGSIIAGDRTIETLIGFDGEQRFNIKNNSWNPIKYSDYSSIDNFDFERERRTFFFLPLYFADEEAGIALLSFDSQNPVDTYETLRRNIATAVRGAGLLSKIQTLSVTDELTGLLNRRGLFQFAYSRLLHLDRVRNLIPVVIIMDMDGLKHINDTYGHAEGDLAIQAFAKLLKKVMREEDIVGRIGGDEFVAFTLIKSEDNIEKLVDRIRSKYDEYNAQKLHPYNVQGSIGAVVLKESTRESFDEAILNADDALYKEKMEKRKKGITR